MSAAPEVRNLEKAALVLMSLGKEQAATVMRLLSEEEVKALSRAFINFTEVGRDLQKEVADEFQKMSQAADKVLVDGGEFARDVINTAFGAKSGAPLLDYISGNTKEPLGNILASIPPQMVENFLQTEHPQTIAFMLTRLSSDLSAELLGKLSDELQTDVLLRISQLDNVKSEVVDDVREVLKTQLHGVSIREEEDIGGPQAAADILNFVESEKEERIMAELAELFPELAEKIRNLMFTFEDLLKLDDRAMQSVLKEVPREELVIALKKTSEDLRGLIFKNMSQRAAQMLKEDLETMGPTKIADVEKAQQGIIEIVRRMESEGKIAIAGGGEDEYV